MFRLFLFITTAALVATTTTSCIEGPGDLPLPGDFDHPVTSEATVEGAFCEDTRAHLDCALSCERTRACDAMPQVFAGDLSECIWVCTMALLGGDDVATASTECLVSSEGDCAQVHACLGEVNVAVHHGDTHTDGGACVNHDDSAIINHPDNDVAGDTSAFLLTCLANPDIGACTAAKLLEQHDLSEACGDCYVNANTCVLTNCIPDCLIDIESEDCVACQHDSGCTPEFVACSGLSGAAPSTPVAPHDQPQASDEPDSECFTDDDCPPDAQCSDGFCDHFSPAPTTNVMECESACDALDACGGIQFAGGSFHLCFSQCLSLSSVPAVVDIVLCVLNASSCEEVVGCAGGQTPVAADFDEEDTPDFDEEDTPDFDEEDTPDFDEEDTPDFDEEDAPDFDEEEEEEEEEEQAPDVIAGLGEEGEHPSPDLCVAACSVVLPCLNNTVNFNTCLQSCATTILTADGLEQFACLFNATGCNDVFVCAGLTDSAPKAECADGDVSGPCGECFCVDGTWMCEDLDCEPEMPDELTCSIACEKVTECMGIDIVNAEGQSCFEQCTTQFFTPEVQDIVNCVLDADDCDAVVSCVTGGTVVEPDTGYETNLDDGSEPNPDDGFVDADGDGVPDEGQDDPMTDADGDGTPDQEQEEPQGNDNPCLGPEPAPPTGCGDIAIERELMITDLSVVNDPTRTFDGCTGTPMGSWTFGSLMTAMAGDNDPSAFVMGWLQQWTVDQELNGFVAPARQAIEDQVIEPWLARSGGETLDLALAPFRLLAIVNRVDLRNPDVDDPSFSAGEGRFVFGLVDPDGGCTPHEFVVILEYGQKADTLEEIQAWAQAWHSLGALEFGEDYNQALEEVTQFFVGAGMDTNKPNGSSINQIRTNEVAFDGPWELREFRIQDDGHLAQVSVKQEPGDGLRESDELAQWINANEGAVLNSTHTVPAEMLGPAAPIEGLWAPNGVENPDARHAFGLNTCSGCHQSETGTPFLHVSNRDLGTETQLSGFLVGGAISDPVSGDIREFNDLERRMVDLCNLVSPDATAADVVDVDPAPACAP